MQRVGSMMQQITVRHVIPWLTFSDSQEAGEVTDATGDAVANMALWDDTAVLPDADPRFLDLIDIIQIDCLASREAAAEAARQIEIEHAHEQEVEAELHHERESYLEFSRVVGWCDRGILSEEAYKFLMSFDKGSAMRQRAREKEWLSGVKARKERHARVDALFKAQSECRRARRVALALAEKLLHIEMTAKVRRFEKWQKSRRKVQIYHDRFDSRIAGYTPDQRERMERYRDSLDKQSRFAFKREKQKQADEKIAELSRFQVANVSDIHAEPLSRFDASRR
jgi:hypothetical protein